MKPNELFTLLCVVLLGACAIDDLADDGERGIPGLAETAGPGAPSGIDFYGALDPVGAAAVDGTGPGQPPVDPPVPDGLPAPAGDPAMDWDGERWFLVWSDSRSGDADIYGAHVSAAGEVDPPTGIRLIGGAGDQREPDVAWNGGMHAVVFSDSGAGHRQVRAARVTAGGTVLDPGGVALSADLQLAHAPAVAASGSSFQVVWEGHCGMIDCPSSISGVRFRSSGVRGPVQTLAEAGTAPAIAWNGSEYLVAWSTAGVERDLAVRAVLASGELGATRELAGRPGDQLTPALAADDSVFLLAWREDDAIVATRVAEGLVLDQDLVVARSSERPALTGNGFGWTIVTSQHLGGETQLRARTLQRTGQLMDAHVVQRLPATGIVLGPCASQSAAGAQLLGWQDVWAADTTIWSALAGADPFLVSARLE